MFLHEGDVLKMDSTSDFEITGGEIKMNDKDWDLVSAVLKEYRRECVYLYLVSTKLLENRNNNRPTYFCRYEKCLNTHFKEETFAGCGIDYIIEGCELKKTDFTTSEQYFQKHMLTICPFFNEG